jgi:hydroxyacylglutathione hydrolase
VKIKQFRYAADNFSYLVYGRRSALAVDGGAVAAIQSFLAANRLELHYLTNTHMHPDHTLGNRELRQATRAEWLDPRDLPEGPAIEIEGQPIQVLHTPGHTFDSITLAVADALITGDTLFNGTIGNCFSQDLQSFYASIKKLMEWPAETRIYAGHDYVLDSMAFARKLEPHNAAIDAFLQVYDPAHVTSRLTDEMQVNPYLRFNTAGIKALLAQKGFPVRTEYQRWEGIMALE